MAIANSADACSRCGFRQCRFVRSKAVVVKKPIVTQQLVAPQVPSTLILQYNAPAPIASLNTSSVYAAHTYSAAALSYRTDPALLLRQAERLALRAQELASQGLELHKEASADAMRSDRLAVALEIMRFALEDKPVIAQSQTLKLELRNGKWEIVQSSVSGTEEAPGASNGAGGSPEGPGRAVIEAKCLRCHSGTDPKGQLNLSGEVSLRQAWRVFEQLADDAMPKEGTPLTAQEKGQVMDYLRGHILEDE